MLPTRPAGPASVYPSGASGVNVYASFVFTLDIHTDAGRVSACSACSASPKAVPERPHSPFAHWFIVVSFERRSSIAFFIGGFLPFIVYHVLGQEFIVVIDSQSSRIDFSFFYSIRWRLQLIFRLNGSVFMASDRIRMFKGSHPQLGFSRCQRFQGAEVTSSFVSTDFR